MDNGNYLLVSMMWTKTIQRGERLLQIPLVKIPGSILCTVHANMVMCKVISAAPDAPQ